ncbi:hypothetical protein, partial [Streptomyces sp. NPDC002666]
STIGEKWNDTMNMSDIKSARITLSPSAQREKVGISLLKIGWKLHSLAENVADEPYEEVWGDRVGDSVVYYVEDELVRVNYITAETRGQERLDSIIAYLKVNLPVLEVDDITHWINTAKSTEERISAASHLGLVSETANPKIVHALREFHLRKTAPELRHAAIFSSSYAAWPEIDVMLEEVGKSDPDSQIRHLSRRVLKAVQARRRS